MNIGSNKKIFLIVAMKMMRKKWDIGKRKQEELNDLAFNNWYNR